MCLQVNSAASQKEERPEVFGAGFCCRHKHIADALVPLHVVARDFHRRTFDAGRIATGDRAGVPWVRRGPRSRHGRRRDRQQRQVDDQVVAQRPPGRRLVLVPNRVRRQIREK